MAFEYIYGRSDEGGKNGIGRRGVRFLKSGRGRRLPGLLYADDLVLRRKSEEHLRAMVGHFVEVCRR